MSPEGPVNPCPPGYYPVYNPDGDGTYICVPEPFVPPVPTEPSGGEQPQPVQAPPPTPFPTTPGPVTVQPSPAPAPTPAPVSGNPVIRQPSAPAAPYVPPGRIALFPGPIFNQPSTGFTGTTSTSTSSSTALGTPLNPVIVNVDNTTNLADNSASNAVQSVASAVYAGINDATAAADGVVQQSLGDVSTALLGTTSAITQGTSAAFTLLLQGIQALNLSVGGALGDIGTTIGTDLVNSLNPVTGVLEALVIAITQQIGGLSGQIAGAVAQVIPLIVSAVENPIGAVKDVLIGIEGDIGNNLASLTQIPGAIASASTSLDATLQRTLASYESFVKSQTGWGDGETNHNDLSNIWKALAGLTTAIGGGANPKLSDELVTLCAGRDLDALLNKPWIPKDLGQGYLWDVWYIFSKLATQVLIWVASVLPVISKTNQEVTQRLDQACPIDLLPPSALVDAVMRGFLPQDAAETEAAKGNLGQSRFQTLQHLALHQMAPAQLLEAVYRGIIPQEDFESALTAQGWTPGQQVILKALGVSLLTVAESLDLYRRGTIDRPTLESILSAHQYDKTQQDAIASLAFRPANFQEAVSGTAASDAFLALGNAVGPQVFTPPEYAESAAASEGLDPQATAQRWLNHWNTGSFGIWTTLYFRGQITLQTLQAIAGREFIPGELVPAFIEAQRPLVQFRTISTMLRLKLVSADAARVLLRQHGYSDANIDLLVGYAQRPSPAKAAQNAAALHSTSLGIAKEEYIDGSITGDQYLAILTQHGYTVDGANTELQVVNAHQALLRRKESAQLVIDEYGAGLIDEQTALAQLAVLGLTVDELARAAHKIRAFRGKNAKHPSEADLNHFLSNGIITADEYVAELVAQGYATKWAKDFLAYRQLPSSPASGSAVQSSPTSTGG
jgi:hypothetical protein